MGIIFDFISSTADAVLAVDRDQKIVLWNEAAGSLFGLKAEEVLGRSCCEVIGGRDESGNPICRQACPNLLMALRQELIQTRDLLIRTRSGHESWISMTTVIVP